MSDYKERIRLLIEKSNKNNHSEDKLVTELMITTENIINVFLEDSERIDIRDARKLNGMSIHVYEIEGPKPHFHLEHKESNFYCAIRLDVPDYFIHDKYTGMLSSGERRALYKFLSRPYVPKKSGSYSIWEHLLDAWNHNATGNKSKCYCPATSIPDYRKHPDKK